MRRGDAKSGFTMFGEKFVFVLAKQNRQIEDKVESRN